MGGSSQTIGYHYLMTLLIGMGRGPIDEVRQIKAGDAIAWDGHACNNDVQVINKPNLFGGPKKEGGIQGLFRLFMGSPTQVLPGASPDIAVGNFGQPGTSSGSDILNLVTTGIVGYLLKHKNGTVPDPYPHGFLPNVKTMVGGLVSEFRGTALLYFDGLICSMNPYPKTWKIRVRRAKKGWVNDAPWYAERAFVFVSEGMVFLTASSKNAVYALQGRTATVTLTKLPADGDTITLNGIQLNFIDSEGSPSQYSVRIQGTVDNSGNRADTAAKLAQTINANTSSLNGTATVSGATVTITLSTVAGVIHAMNPAHIIYQAVTDPAWGRGLDADLIDENSFVYAANLFCAEGMGLCLKWSRGDINIDDFIQKVLDHVAAVLYTDRETGLLVLRPTRSDYNVTDLPVYGPESGLLDIGDDDTASSDSVYNECIVTGHSPINDEDIQARSQSPAGRIAQGSASTLTQTFEGLPTVSLCGRVAQRNLKASISGLKKLSLTLDRRAWRIAPGMPFVINYPARGINGMIVRAGEIDDGTMAQGTIKIKAVQDVFGLPANAFTQPTQSGWVPLNFDAVPAADEQAYEASYRDLYLAQEVGKLPTLDDKASYIVVVAASPAMNSRDYDLKTITDGDEYWTDGGTTTFTANFTSLHAIGPTDTEITVDTSQGFDGDGLGTAVLMDNEVMGIVSFNNGTQILTVDRGGVDTFPAAHAAGTRGWLIDDDAGTDGRKYVAGEEVHARVLSNTSQDQLLIDNAPDLDVMMTDRAIKPYPPANVTVNTFSIYDIQSTAPVPTATITWVERNRITQADHIVGYFDAGVSAEAGTTFRVRIYDTDNTTLLATHDGITTPYVYDPTMQAADGVSTNCFMEIVAVRDGFESTIKRFKVSFSGGYGMGYGLHYGGA